MNTDRSKVDDSDTRTPGRVQALERAITLLQAVATTSPEGDSAASLAARCGLNRATAWRLLSTMEDHSLIERDPSSGRYSVGFAIARMATRSGVDGLVRRAHPTVERVCAETGETANLAVLRHRDLTYVDEVTPPAVLTARWLGRPAPLHATSAGKAMLAWLPESEVDSVLSGPLPAHTESTITDHARLREELAEIREWGYAASHGEMEPSLYGVSAAVLDARDLPFAVVGIWGPRERVGANRFEPLGALAQRAAAEISYATGEA